MSQVAAYVLQVTTGTGTGNLDLIAADTLAAPYNPIYAAGFADTFGTGSGNKFYYGISHATAHEREWGIGYMSDADTLVRETVIGSTNANAAVDFSAGTKVVTCDITPGIQNYLVGLTGNVQTQIDDINAELPPNRFTYFTDYVTQNGFPTNNDFTNAASGTGTASNTRVADEVGHYGVLRLETGTTATGGAIHVMAQNLLDFDNVSGVVFSIKSWIKVVDLPTVAQDFVLFSGFISNGSVAPLTSPLTISGCGISLSSANANFQCAKYEGAGPVSYTDSGVTAAANTWYEIEIRVISNATAADVTVEYYIDGVLVGTRTSTTSGASYRACPIQLVKTAGLTEVVVYIDKFLFQSWIP